MNIHVYLHYLYDKTPTTNTDAVPVICFQECFNVHEIYISQLLISHSTLYMYLHQL